MIVIFGGWQYTNSCALFSFSKDAVTPIFYLHTTIHVEFWISDLLHTWCNISRIWILDLTLCKRLCTTVVLVSKDLRKYWGRTKKIWIRCWISIDSAKYHFRNPTWYKALCPHNMDTYITNLATLEHWYLSRQTYRYFTDASNIYIRYCPFFDSINHCYMDHQPVPILTRNMLRKHC